MSADSYLIGDTVKLTWVNSGVTPSAISGALYNGSDTLVSSAAMTSSGNGHYYLDITVPNSLGFYVAETLATVNSLPYKNRIKFRAVRDGVD